MKIKPILLGGLLVFALSVTAWGVFTLVYGLSTGVSVVQAAPALGAYFRLSAPTLFSLLVGWRVARRTSAPVLTGVSVGFTYPLILASISIAITRALQTEVLLVSIGGGLGGAIGGLLARNYK